MIFGGLLNTQQLLLLILEARKRIGRIDLEIGNYIFLCFQYLDVHNISIWWFQFWLELLQSWCIWCSRMDAGHWLRPSAVCLLWRKWKKINNFRGSSHGLYCNLYNLRTSLTRLGTLSKLFELITLPSWSAISVSFDRLSELLTGCAITIFFGILKMLKLKWNKCDQISVTVWNALFTTHHNEFRLQRNTTQTTFELIHNGIRNVFVWNVRNIFFTKLWTNEIEAEKTCAENLRVSILWWRFYVYEFREIEMCGKLFTILKIYIDARIWQWYSHLWRRTFVALDSIRFSSGLIRIGSQFGPMMLKMVVWSFHSDKRNQLVEE